MVLAFEKLTSLGPMLGSTLRTPSSLNRRGC